ncbi:type VI secretion system baseplate subunit TssE, partial [Klebsiella pneumoniae]|uniref:type VI secretion system baseplate subunit TssE n=1 Tax=Klebsiella pneumoniae TaxID=573 RepID=UPI0034D1D933|nr:type VI secretion system baseplate subunit TssE [Klebsiella pneumoniae]
MNDKRPPHYDGGDLRHQGYRYRQDSERLTSRDKMQPVLLDMLTDDEPQKKQEAQVRNLVSHSELRRRVVRDLQWLFNCVNSESNLDLGDFPQVRRSTLNSGIASRAGKRMSDIE